jgi:hypothetical protein
MRQETSATGDDEPVASQQASKCISPTSPLSMLLLPVFSM